MNASFSSRNGRRLNVFSSYSYVSHAFLGLFGLAVGAQFAKAADGNIFSVATYNIEGMSDSQGAPFPYDFSATLSNWVQDRMYEVKAKRIAEALTLAGSPDIVALEEVKYLDGRGTQLQVMAPFLDPLGYKYKVLGPQTPKGPKGYTTSDTPAIISKYPIVSVEGLRFDDPNFPGAARDPLAVTINVNGSLLRMYAVHTKAKVTEKTPQDAQTGNSIRKAMLQVVRADIERQRAKDPNVDIIVVGDMNANYFEDSIVNGLGVTGDESAMLTNGNSEGRLYNLWYELNPEDRCTLSFMGTRDCIDQINISASMYDNNGIQYVDNSFSIAGMKEWWRSPLANATGTGKRWQTKTQDVTDPSSGRPAKYTTHIGYGYSDHIPIVAKFRVVGNTGNTSRMTLSSAPAKEVAHGKLFFHIPFCTSASGAFVPGEVVRNLSENDDLSSDEILGRCVSLENGSIPLKVVDRYDTRVDYGFEFNSSSPFLKSVSINFQYDDQNAGGRVINRNQLAQQFADAVSAATAAGKRVSLVSVKGRLDVNFGKVTLFAESAPVLKIED